jgi:hypothetical protein
MCAIIFSFSFRDAFYFYTYTSCQGVGHSINTFHIPCLLRSDKGGDMQHIPSKLLEPRVSQEMVHYWPSGQLPCISRTRNSNSGVLCNSRLEIIDLRHPFRYVRDQIMAVQLASAEQKRVSRKFFASLCRDTRS